MKVLARIVQALHPARATLGIVVLVFVPLAAAPQTADMLRCVSDTSRNCIEFQVALLFLAWAAWFWSRAALNAEFGIRDSQRAIFDASGLTKEEKAAWRWGPRALFTAVAATGLLITVRSGDWTQAAVILVWAGIGLLILWHRKNKPARSPGKQTPGLPLAAGAPWSAQRFARVFVGLGFAVFIACCIETYLQPGWCRPAVWVAVLCPGPASAIASFALMLGPLTWLTCWWDRRPRRRPFPIITPVVVYMLVMAYYLPLHLVRVADQKLVSIDQRATIKTAFTDWATHCSTSAKTLRPVIVALEGGGSLAGLWSARVLHDVDAAVPQDAGGIFAISSVSGGSLGAANYVSLRSLNENRCRLSGAALADPTMTRFRSDLLGPVLSAAILDDTARALTAPLAWVALKPFGLWPERGGDRAAGFERGFERAWQAKPSPRVGPIDLSAPFLSLFYDPGLGWRKGMPIWISNGTDENTGRRLLTIPVRADDPQLKDTWPFQGARDVLSLLKADVPISTAVHNSARFPFLSPAGEVCPVDGCRGDQDAEIVDGGYFENSGVTTASELADLLIRNGNAWAKLPVSPILVVVTSDADPRVDGSQVPRCGSGPSDDPAVEPTGSSRDQLTAPLVTILSVRSGHGSYAIETAREKFCNQTAPQAAIDAHAPTDTGRYAFFHFYLHPPPNRELPLNWVLSKQTASDIWGGMGAHDNKSERKRLVTAMSYALPFDRSRTPNVSLEFSKR